MAGATPKNTERRRDGGVASRTMGESQSKKSQMPKYPKPYEVTG